MKEGEICEPLRSGWGFHLIELYRKTPSPGRVRVAHILIAFPSDNPTEEQTAAMLLKADSIYELAVAGEDFAELARQFSSDTVNGKRGGVLPYFGLGGMVEPFEKMAFALENVGDISKPVQTRYGFHVLKLLDRKKKILFEEMEAQLYESMRQSDRNFDLHRSFDEKMKKRFGYVFYPEAYDELRQLADEYFPTDTSFYYAGMKYTKPLITLKGIDFPQYEFVDYLLRQPISAKTFSLDFMQEIFDRFVHNIVTEMERETLETDYSDYNMLIKEYYDGILLFEISNKRVWSQPAEEQDKLEAEWLKELTEKYPVTLNKKVIKSIKKYLN
jgi:peptidyl-prolyl cis-trans isomerase SurA